MPIKHIQYEAKLSEDRKIVSVRIINQTHFCSDFSNRHSIYDPGMGIFKHEDYVLYSSVVAPTPRKHTGRNGSYVLASNSSKEDRDTCIRMFPQEYQRFKAAVEAYNKKFSKEVEEEELTKKKKAKSDRLRDMYKWHTFDYGTEVRVTALSEYIVEW